MQIVEGAMLWAAIVSFAASTSVWGQGEALLVPEGAEVKKLFGGFRFVEGPAADRDGNVFFTDIPNNRIYKIGAEGALSVFREKSGGANGLMFDAENRLVACEGDLDYRRVTRTEADGSVTVLAERFEGKRLNSPNDLTIACDGGIYFTDPRYGDRGGMEQPVEGVYHIAPDGMITRVIGNLVRPNGILLSIDNRMLYVMDEGANEVYAYTVQADASVTAGNLYIAAQTGIVVLSPEGEQLATIPTPARPCNSTFAGKDRKTLYITAGNALYTIRMNIPGRPAPCSQPTPVSKTTWGKLKRKTRREKDR
jgi:gluconolactonase